MAVHYHEGRFPPQKLDWERIAPHLAIAMAELARYDTSLSIIPNQDILLSPLLMAEATTSSRIEGTRATMSDVLAYEAGMVDVDPEKRNDIQEVINYRNAVHVAEDMLKELPLTGRVLRATHAVLLQGVRGEMKSPGRYRIDQVFIGPSNDISEARYMPPKAAAVPDAMAAWERYANDEAQIPLIKAALAHAEFEAIHPFSDGNGRIGRMVIPLMFTIDGIIANPCFYLSEFFEHRNTEYQDMLLAVSERDAWTEWCVFFLDAVASQAKENALKARGIFNLYENTLDFIMSAVRSDNAARVTPFLFKMAVFPSSTFTKDAGLSEGTSRRLIKALKDDERIVEILPHRGNNPAVFAFPELLRLVEGVSLSVRQS